MNVPETLSRIILVLTLGSSALLAACEENSSPGTGGAGGSSTTAMSSVSSSAVSSGSGIVGPELKFVAQFSAMNNELPQGLAITPDGRTAYVGYAPTGKIV